MTLQITPELEPGTPDHKVSNWLWQNWAQFAKSGQPNENWPQFDPKAQFFMDITENPEIKTSGLFGSNKLFWDQITQNRLAQQSKL